MTKYYLIWFVTLIVIYLFLYHTEYLKNKFKKWIEKL